jgi:signal transduction histidine kinase
MKVNDWFDITLPVTCKWNWPDLLLRNDASFDLQVTQDALDRHPKLAIAKGLRLTGGLYITEEPDTVNDDDDGDDDDDDVVGPPPGSLNGAHGRGYRRRDGSFSNRKQQYTSRGTNGAPPVSVPVLRRSAIFLVQPDVESLKELRQRDLTWSDIPKHSSQQRLIFLAEHLKSETYIGQKSRSEVALTQHMLEMKRMFVRYVSHEVRTPLNTVSMGLKLIQSLREPTQMHQHQQSSDQSSAFHMNGAFDMVDEIKESCDIAIDILNDLLLYEKLEGGILSLDKRCETALATVYEVRIENENE